MVTARKIHCFVVVADAENDGMPQPTQPRFRPSDLLPWADPHIRSLVEQLQSEVREEESVRRAELAEFEAELAEVEAKLENLEEWAPEVTSVATPSPGLAAPGARRF